ncbi:major royal jelly family protein [Roseateles amylovorans]|uniref:Major royal jelly family protein n=1 Tax=Roseateles amylovorans TaxID=2978473 RepID=A0ABY6B2J9_9BURK|nr:major royal jelly family protein [Roseateles amylovorans]UXH78441.1 major royal jelly family protein [Roseateles amylovorans]
MSTRSAASSRHPETPAFGACAHTGSPQAHPRVASRLTSLSALRRFALATVIAMGGASSAFAIEPGALEVVAELPIRPGNVAPAPKGRLFATVHPLGAPTDVQLIEISGRDSYKPWPSAALQRGTGTANDDQIDTPLGITIDSRQRLWITDMGLNLGKTRLWAFDIASGRTVHRIELPAEVAPKGSFVQDLAVDANEGWVYLADIANPGLIAVEIATGQARRFGGHPSLQAEPDATMVIGGKAIQFQGAPAKVAVNPITLSADRRTVFFGAMNGKTWYSVPARLLRTGVSDEQTAAAVRRVGPKPVSDGATTSRTGSHFFTNLNESGIDRLGADGKLTPVVRDARLDWPDSVHFGGDAWLYISVNQLYKTPAFTGGADEGRPPYRVMRVWTGPATK